MTGRNAAEFAPIKLSGRGQRADNERPHDVSTTTPDASTPDDGGGRSLPDALNLRRIAEASAVLAGSLYAGGWLFLALYFAEFDVTPETVGVSFEFIVVRAGILLVATMVVTALVVSLVPGRIGKLVADGGWRMPNLAFLVVLSLFASMLVGVLTFLGTTWRPWTLVDGPWNVIAATAYILISLTVVASSTSQLLVWSGYKAGARNILIKKPVASVFIVALVVVAATGALVTTAPRLADRVRDGGEFSIFGLRADRVRVHWVEPADAAELGVDPADCATLLGKRDGDFILFYPTRRDGQREKTVIVNSELVVVARVIDAKCKLGPEERK